MKNRLDPFSPSRGTRIRRFALVLLLLGPVTPFSLLGQAVAASSNEADRRLPSMARMTADLQRAFEEAEPLRFELMTIRREFFHRLTPEQMALAMAAFEEDFGEEISRLSFLDQQIAELTHDIHVYVSQRQFLDRDEADLIVARREMHEAPSARGATSRALVTDLETSLRSRERAVNQEVETIVSGIRSKAQGNQKKEEEN